MNTVIGMGSIRAGAAAGAADARNIFLRKPARNQTAGVRNPCDAFAIRTCAFP